MLRSDNSRCLSHRHTNIALPFHKTAQHKLLCAGRRHDPGSPTYMTNNERPRGMENGSTEDRLGYGAVTKQATLIGTLRITNIVPINMPHGGPPRFTAGDVIRTCSLNRSNKPRQQLKHRRYRHRHHRHHRHRRLPLTPKAPAPRRCFSACFANQAPHPRSPLYLFVVLDDTSLVP